MVLFVDVLSGVMRKIYGLARPKNPSIPRVTYATAQKMRAAVSHKFGT